MYKAIRGENKKKLKKNLVVSKKVCTFAVAIEKQTYSQLDNIAEWSSW